jgi:hypothetical protein
MEKRKERALNWYRMGKTIADMEAWDSMVKVTDKATKGKNRTFDPFVGYIEKEKRS